MKVTQLIVFIALTAGLSQAHAATGSSATCTHLKDAGRSHEDQAVAKHKARQVFAENVKQQPSSRAKGTTENAARERGRGA